MNDFNYSFVESFQSTQAFRQGGKISFPRIRMFANEWECIEWTE